MFIKKSPMFIEKILVRIGLFLKSDLIFDHEDDDVLNEYIYI